MNTVKNLVVLCTALILGGAYVLGKHVEKGPAPREPMTVSVSASESVSATPDTAELNFGVTTGRQSDPVQAMDNLSGKMNAALGAVKKLGNLRRYSEDTARPQQERYRALADGVGSGPPTPAGSQTLTVSVTLTYELQ